VPATAAGRLALMEVMAVKVAALLILVGLLLVLQLLGLEQEMTKSFLCFVLMWRV
jgi:hypothetical protein